jgi:hypothetical protein
MLKDRDLGKCPGTSAFLPPHRVAWRYPLAQKCSPTQRSVQTIPSTPQPRTLFARRRNHRFRPSRLCPEAEAMFAVSPASRSFQVFWCHKAFTRVNRAQASLIIARGRL